MLSTLRYCYATLTFSTPFFFSLLPPLPHFRCYPFISLRYIYFHSSLFAIIIYMLPDSYFIYSFIDIAAYFIFYIAFSHISRHPSWQQTTKRNNLVNNGEPPAWGMSRRDYNCS